MRLPQRFKRVPHQEPAEDQDIILPAYPSQPKLDVKGDVELYRNDGFESVRVDTEYIAGAHATEGYQLPHGKSWVEVLEDRELHYFGTRLISVFYNNVVSGWRAGLLRAFLASLLALIANVCVFAWLVRRNNPEDGTGTIHTAACGAISTLETGIKVALNVISTLILGASTYAMQGTTAPTRDEVQSAHKKGKWLEIGTQSWRNLSYVSKRHATIWSVLAFTSLPLHLVFNAVFFTTTETYQYAVAVVDRSFQNNTAFQATPNNSSPDLRFGKEQFHPSECIRYYTEGFTSSYSDIVVVSNASQPDSPVLWTRYPQRILTQDKKTTNHDSYHWVCHDIIKNSSQEVCSRKKALDSLKTKPWTVYGHPVHHCLVRTAPDRCRLQYNVWIMGAVVVFSTIKVLAIAALVFTHPDGTFLRTIGDAIASFLENPDPTTENMCLVSSTQVRKHGFATSASPQALAKPRANTAEFFSMVGVSAAYVVTLSGVLGWAIFETKGDAYDTDLGRPSIQQLANLKPDDTGSSVIVPTLLTANIPQLGFSLLYVFYTNIWAKLLVAHEFDRLTTCRKGLRVSERPRGEQRISHFFTLPTRYALPIMFCSAALHWLCSRSLFMARFDGVNVDDVVDSGDQIVRLAYSIPGMTALVAVTFAMAISTVCIAGFRRLRTGLGEIAMSAVISAACHVKRREDKPWERKVQWGDVGNEEVVDGEIVRHCAFTSLDSRPPTEGFLYL
ncbi:uncharacterized protein M421DRAFT_55896 [Didymella exigua CBS 183.55]|uniref:DUF6536 domain-containing protein n=1 Tax=Didymella exigua CBS 183.55 TaxID=1150837 RepID=A0A6A5RZA6_9PLEO|nr:uncharacterized protein M421DRAFT_55896 [Didymella exigua CBS 183.55]KAF1931586.1 hypothetical protein M421DRAFT_55896 [Didymella exigua CBS 183.55]